MSTIEIINTFSFLRPQWLLSLPLISLVWFSHHVIKNNHAWQSLVADNFIAALSINQQHKKSRSKYSLMIGLFLCIIAASGPSVKTNQQDVYESNDSTIIIADASLSMLATDLTPSRKQWMQLKIQDIVKQQSSGMTALIIYSADAHVISPLTKDRENILHLTQVIEPEILPLKGSNPESAFLLAAEMFEKNSVAKGKIIWLTDGIESTDIKKIKKQVGSHQLLTLLVGTELGGPIKLENGEYLKVDKNIIIPKVDTNIFDQLSTQTNQNWQWLTRDDIDIQWLSQQKSENITLENEYIQRIDLGLYLALFAGLFLMGFMRPNSSGVALILCIGIIFPKETYANDTWQSYDSQGIEALENNEFEKAAKLFENPRLKAYAHLKNNEYDQAIDILENSDLELNADDHYNLGQAKAKKQDFETALEHFQSSKSLKDSDDVNQAIDTTQQLINFQQQQQTNTETSTESSTDTNTETSTETQTSTETSTQSSTSTDTSTSTSTQTSSETSTDTKTSTSTDTSTDTSTQTSTDESTDTNTQTDDNLDSDEKRDLEIEEDLLLFYKNQFERQFRQNNGQQFSKEGPKW